MKHRMFIASFVILSVIFGAARGHTQSNETAQATATADSPAPVQRILTKDPEYLKLLAPPGGNEFLKTYSKGYREKEAEIEAGVADISDENLRSQARSDEWARMQKKDQDRFRNEAEVSFNDAKILFSQKHRDGLFEVGHVSYDENNSSLVVNTSPTAPIEANFRVVMNSTTINQIYAKFRQIASQEIDQKAREYVSKAGAGSNCSRNQNLCYMFAKVDIERSLRSERMVVVAQGDLADRRIDRLLLVDYETEAVFLDLDPHISSFDNAAWRFSVGLALTISPDLQSTETQVQPVAGATTGGGPSPNRDAPSGNFGESAPDMPISSNNPPRRVRLPGKVTAAAIVTQTMPVYPPQARGGHVQGDVVLHAIIDKEGTISEVQVLSGDDLLAQSALEAVRQWRYKPMLVDGKPTEVDTTFTVTFSLSD